MPNRNECGQRAPAHHTIKRVDVSEISVGKISKIEKRLCVAARAAHPTVFETGFTFFSKTRSNKGNKRRPCRAKSESVSNANAVDPTRNTSLTADILAYVSKKLCCTGR